MKLIIFLMVGLLLGVASAGIQVPQSVSVSPTTHLNTSATFIDGLPLTAKGVSSANSAQNVTVTGVTGKNILVTGYSVFAAGANTTAQIDITLCNGALAKVYDSIPKYAVDGSSVVMGPISDGVLRCTTSGNAVLMVSAGGTSVVTNATIFYKVV